MGIIEEAVSGLIPPLLLFHETPWRSRLAADTRAVGRIRYLSRRLRRTRDQVGVTRVAVEAAEARQVLRQSLPVERAASLDSDRDVRKHGSLISRQRGLRLFRDEATSRIYERGGLDEGVGALGHDDDHNV